MHASGIAVMAGFFAPRQVSAVDGVFVWETFPSKAAGQLEWQDDKDRSGVHGRSFGDRAFDWTCPTMR
jgi:hypothetical protein